MHILYGSANGLSAAGNQFWNQDSPGVDDQVEGTEQFGHALAVADFDADGAADLAIGAYLEGLGGIAAAGVAHVLYGSGVGLSAVGSQYFHQDIPGMPGKAAAGDGFGFALGAR